MTVQQLGTDFIPANPIELIANDTDISTFDSCYYRCYLNIKCRTIVSDTTWPFVCQLYEGSIDTGTLIPSLSLTSRVSNFLYNTTDYSNYNQTCNINSFTLYRFLICSGDMGYSSGCLSQYNGSYSWGQQYGGVSSRSDCANLPISIQAGCYWRFDWFQNADNPNITFVEVPCPADLTAKTNCVRN